MGRQRKRPGWLARLRTRIATAAEACGTRIKDGVNALWKWLRPWRPIVQVDLGWFAARRLRRAVVRATRQHYRSLGVQPPQHLLIAVQSTVVEGERLLTSLLQIFEAETDGQKRQRHVLFVALTVGDDELPDEAVVAAVRQRLHEVVGEALGDLVCSVGCDAPRPRRQAPVVAMPRRQPERAQAQPPYVDDNAPFPDDGDAPVASGAYAAGR